MDEEAWTTTIYCLPHAAEMLKMARLPGGSAISSSQAAAYRIQPVHTHAHELYRDLGQGAGHAVVFGMHLVRPSYHHSSPPLHPCTERRSPGCLSFSSEPSHSDGCWRRASGNEGNGVERFSIDVQEIKIGRPDQACHAPKEGLRSSHPHLIWSSLLSTPLGPRWIDGRHPGKR